MTIDWQRGALYFAGDSPSLFCTLVNEVKTLLQSAFRIQEPMFWINPKIKAENRVVVQFEVVAWMPVAACSKEFQQYVSTVRSFQDATKADRKKFLARVFEETAFRARFNAVFAAQKSFLIELSDSFPPPIGGKEFAVVFHGQSNKT